MSIEHLLNTAADMKRPVADYDDMGDVSYSLVQFSGAHLCRISSSVPSEITSGPTEYAEATAVVYVLAGTEFKRDDEVHHGETVYKVLGVREPSVENHHVSLICKVTSDGV